LDYEGAEILLGVPSKSAQARLRGCAKEPWTVQWIEGWIQPDEVLYDIGANVGAYSLVAALSPAVRARVVAVEPGYPTFAALSDNVVRNRAQGRVTALPVALGRSTTLQSLQLRTLSDPGLRTLLTELEEEVAAQLEGVLAAHGLHLHERFRREDKPGIAGSGAPQPAAYGLFTRDGGT
jgi:FkbM family methyltransferase